MLDRLGSGTVEGVPECSRRLSDPELYAATRALLKAWSSGRFAGADKLMLDLSMDLHASVDAQNAIEKIAKVAKDSAAFVPPKFVGV